MRILVSSAPKYDLLKVEVRPEDALLDELHAADVQDLVLVRQRAHRSNVADLDDVLSVLVRREDVPGDDVARVRSVCVLTGIARGQLRGGRIRYCKEFCFFVIFGL